MAGKLLIQCQLVTLTGMHIGGTDSFSAIGAADSTVVRDACTGRHIVPGSSIKGKLRSLLARSLSGDIEKLPDFNDDDERIKRLFGSSKPVRAARVQFADAFVINYEEMKNVGLTEVKSENTINRATSVSNPRQIERVNPGVKFGLRISYNVQNDRETAADMELLAKGMKLLQLDYLGGHGSRGSGRVSLRCFKVTDERDTERKDIEKIFQAVNDYELFAD